MRTRHAIERQMLRFAGQERAALRYTPRNALCKPLHAPDRDFGHRIEGAPPDVLIGLQRTDPPQLLLEPRNAVEIARVRGGPTGRAIRGAKMQYGGFAARSYGGQSLLPIFGNPTRPRYAPA